MTNKYFATILTLIIGALLSLGGYNNVWPLFGAANCLSSSLITHNLDLFKNNFFNAEKLLKMVMVFSFVLKKING